VRRREFIGLLSCVMATSPRRVQAQAEVKRRLVGVLSPFTRESGQSRVNAFLLALREHGRIDGKTIELEYRYADGDATRFTTLAEELVRLKPDVIVTGSTNAAMALKQATATIPIVSASFTDPVAMGLITSLARPGGNVTGMIVTLEGLPGKLLQLLLELMPGLTRVGLIVTVNEIQSVLLRRATEAAAATMDVTLVPVEVRSRESLGGAFQGLMQAHVEAVLATPGGVLLANERSDFAARALAAGLPTMFSNREFVEAGGLMSYGNDRMERWRRAAYFVDRILKGAKPADLPVEIPAKFELVVNLKTAKALGITIPQSILFRADEVIE
jgi:putative tryptophan/tyrosine transport system substrate-binding protein